MTREELVWAVALGLLANEAGDWCPWIAHRLVRWSACRRYQDNHARAAIRAEELAALIDDRPGKLFKLLTALGMAGAAAITLVRDSGTRRAHVLQHVALTTRRRVQHWHSRSHRRDFREFPTQPGQVIGGTLTRRQKAAANSIPHAKDRARYVMQVYMDRAARIQFWYLPPPFAKRLFQRRLIRGVLELRQAQICSLNANIR